MITFIIGLILGIVVGAGGLILVTMAMMVDVEDRLRKKYGEDLS